MSTPALVGMVGLMAVTACSGGPPGRMALYLDQDLNRSVPPARMPIKLPVEDLSVGLMVLNDTTAPQSAPPLSAARWTLMVDLTRERFEQEFRGELTLVAPPDIKGALGSERLRELGRRRGIETLVFVVLSSEDDEEPTHLGQGYMMTQLPGVTVTNRAVAEIAWLDLTGGMVLARATGRGSEVLEELDVPLGQDLPSKVDARDILRLHATLHALDRAILELTAQIRRPSQLSHP